MNKKLIVAGLVTTGVIGAAILAPITAFAQANTSSTDSFVSKLAIALGIEESQVQTAVDSVHSEIQTERQAELTTKINQAVTDGKLTQRQADLLLGIQSAREELMANKEESPPEEINENLTEEERKAQMDTQRAEHEQEMLDALNAKGLNTTQDELDATREAARDAGLRMIGGKGAGRGMGMRP